MTSLMIKTKIEVHKIVDGRVEKETKETKGRGKRRRGRETEEERKKGRGEERKKGGGREEEWKEKRRENKGGAKRGRGRRKERRGEGEEERSSNLTCWTCLVAVNISLIFCCLQTSFLSRSLFCSQSG